MDDQNLELLLKYPLMSLTVEGNNRLYTGKILSGNRDFNVHIIEDSKHNFRVKTSFREEFDATAANLKSPDIVGFLDKFTILLEEKQRISPQNRVDLYRRILREYSEFTDFYLNIKKCQLESDLSKISVVTLDDGRREHSLEIHVDFDETTEIFSPQGFNLPEPLLKNLPSKSGHLIEIYTKFSAAIEELQPFFNTMDSLDESCCILDPEHPTKRDCFRRIWLILVTVDPLNVHSRPELRFLGPERVVQPYLQNLNAMLEEWNENTDLVEGLLQILELDAFPHKPEEQRVMLMDVGECSICFSLRFNERLPEVICDNKSCENFYHVECLYQWLTSVNSKRLFKQIHGQCPNCEKKITCPMPEVQLPPA